MLKNIKPLAVTLPMVFLLRMKKREKHPPHTYEGGEVNKRLFEF